MDRLRFRVVTSVTGVLACLALFRVVFEDRIPPLPPNGLEGVRGEFMARGVHQPINWREMNPEAFADARRQSKPILLVVGAPWSRLGRQIDDETFSNGEVAKFIGRNFIAVRVDSTQAPQWLGAFLPLERIQLRFLDGMQIWVLDPKGRLIDAIFRNNAGARLDRTQMIRALIHAQQAFVDAETSMVPPDFAARQESDRRQVNNAIGVGTPEFASYADSLASSIDNELGSFPQNGMVAIWPHAWRYLMLVGRHNDLERSLRPVLHSPVVDITHGGFFRLGRTREGTGVQFDKVAMTNADMVDLLTEWNLIHPDPLVDRLAHETFDFIVRDLRQFNTIGFCQPGDEGPRDRSRSASFSPKSLQRILDGEEIGWVRENLGLNPSTNPQMIPYFTDRVALNDPRLHDILNRLRAQAGEIPPPAGSELLDANGYSVARLVRAARLWGDPVRLAEALRIVTALDSFRTGEDVVHRLGDGNPGTYVGDYLAYADAALQDYLATGRVVSFTNGLAVLKRALLVYRGPAGEILLARNLASESAPDDTEVSEIADSIRASCTAQTIAVATAYARLLGPTPEGRRLLAAAEDQVGLFSRLEDVSSPALGAYFAASAGTVDSQAAFVVGANGQQAADQLARLRPNRLVAAVAGPVRPDLQRRAPGIYLTSTTSVAGPFTVEQAAERLQPVLSVGVVPN